MGKTKNKLNSLRLSALTMSTENPTVLLLGIYAKEIQRTVGKDLEANIFLQGYNIVLQTEAYMAAYANYVPKATYWPVESTPLTTEPLTVRRW